jgi:hypothetical protein
MKSRKKKIKAGRVDLPTLPTLEQKQLWMLLLLRADLTKEQSQARL